MKTKTQISFAVTAKLISAFVFATRIVHFFFLNPKFQASSLLLCLYSSVCIRPVLKPHCWFSHEVAHTKRCIIFTGKPQWSHKKDNVDFLIRPATQSVKMDCDVRGYPTPVITWFKDGKPIKPDGNKVCTLRKLMHCTEIFWL